MNKWYFTFGQGQVLEGHFVIIEASSRDLARKTMMRIFGREWAFQYSEEEWFEDGISQQEKYGYKEYNI